jgi:hypothetical protein
MVFYENIKKNTIISGNAETALAVPPRLFAAPSSVALLLRL